MSLHSSATSIKALINHVVLVSVDNSYIGIDNIQEIFFPLLLQKFSHVTVVGIENIKLKKYIENPRITYDNLFHMNPEEVMDYLFELVKNFNKENKKVIFFTSSYFFIAKNVIKFFNLIWKIKESINESDGCIILIINNKSHLEDHIKFLGSIVDLKIRITANKSKTLLLRCSSVRTDGSKTDIEFNCSKENDDFKIEFKPKILQAEIVEKEEEIKDEKLETLPFIYSDEKKIQLLKAQKLGDKGMVTYNYDSADDQDESDPDDDIII